VTLRGAPDNVAKAKDSIKQLLEEALSPQEGEMEEKIPCPAGIVGRIIGRGGETIRWGVQQHLHWGWLAERVARKGG
jgi:far upstream element-binding protein